MGIVSSFPCHSHSQRENSFLVIVILAMFNVYPVALHKTKKVNIADITMTGKISYKVGLNTLYKQGPVRISNSVKI